MNLDSGQPYEGFPPGVELLEIDISVMDTDDRAEFLSFLVTSGIGHQVTGYLLVVAAKDEQRTRELLAAVTQDDLVELDPESVDENSDWARTVAAMLHPSGRCDAIVMVGPARRIVGAVISYTVWWLAVIAAFAVFAIVLDEPTFALMVAVFMLPVLGETWLTATRGSSPGKYLLNMRVASLEGGHPGWLSAVIRSVVLTWPFMLMFVGGPIGTAAFLFAFIWITVLTISIVRDPGHRGIHDRVAGTRVVDGRLFPRVDATTADV